MGFFLELNAWDGVRIKEQSRRRLCVARVDGRRGSLRRGPRSEIVAGVMPVAGSLTFGALTGYCSGYFLKKAGKAVAATFGAVFILFQMAALKGYVQVHWDRIERDVMCLLDLNKDGKVDYRDSKYALQKTVDILSSNMAATGTGFTGGFLTGWRAG